MFTKSFIATLVVFSLLFFHQRAFTQTLIKSIEAETGALVGLNIAAQTGNSSGTYVTGFDAAGDKVTVTINVANAGMYNLKVTYRANQGQKVQTLQVNGANNGDLTFPAGTTFVDLDAGNIWLNAGNNTLGILNSWGYLDVDKFSLYTATTHTYNVATNLIDPNATQEAKDLYDFIKCQFGKNIISGQTDGYYPEAKTQSGKSAMVRTWDFTTYTDGYPWKWANGGYTLGANPDGSTEKAIAWYNTTNKKGMVGFHWHWHSPLGGTPGTNAFYTTGSTFDITKAVVVGSNEYTLCIRDIDVIAVELKKLQAAKIPVLWRPLHEAGGAWFWWGAKGAAPCKAMWDIIYDRIVNYHGIHNLIWEWSTPEQSWYVGNTKCDIVGYDSYPTNFDYTVQKTMFDQLYTNVGGQKIIAMTENGPVPDIQKCLAMDAPWAYFMTWNDFINTGNTNQHMIDVFADAKVLSLENPGVACATSNPTPTVTITAPANNTISCSGTAITINANPTITTGSISKVDFYDGTTLLGTDNTSPYSYTWASPSTGAHTIGVIATSAVNVASTKVTETITVNAIPAIPTVTSPVNYTQNATAVTLTATGTALKWYTIVTGGTALTATPIPATTAIGTTNYYVSQTVNTCESARATIAVVVSAPISQKVSLKVGWNIIGCPISGSTAIAKALSSIWTNVETVKNLDSFYSSANAPALNSLTTVEWGKGYMIKVTKACDLDWIVQ